MKNLKVLTQDRLIFIHCGKFSPENQVKTVGPLETFQRFH